VHIERLVFIAAVLAASVVGCVSQDQKPADGKSQTSNACKHVVEIASQGKQLEAAAIAQVQGDCEASLGELENLHASLTACLLAANSTAAIEACEHPARSYASVVRSLNPTVEQICKHIMDVMTRELGTEGSDMSASDLRSFTQDCISELERDKEKQEKEAFAKLASCLIKVETMDELQDCEPERYR
jgi:hypothetical protein